MDALSYILLQQNKDVKRKPYVETFEGAKRWPAHPSRKFPTEYHIPELAGKGKYVVEEFDFNNDGISEVVVRRFDRDVYDPYFINGYTLVRSKNAIFRCVTNITLMTESGSRSGVG
jgi:hypothetical protein